MNSNPSIIAPPPWNLKGNGYIFLFHFSKDFIQKNGFLADYQKDTYKHGLVGTIMLVDYAESAVGPYRELLFVPGQFQFPKAPSGLWGITKIYVSSYDSVWNGIENWGIPKELAEFEITKINDKEEVFDVKISGKTFFKAHLKKWGIHFPITTAFFPLKLAQKLRKDLIITNSPAKGKACFAKLVDIEINQELFPDVSEIKPLAILSVKDFQMTFPKPVVLKDYF